MTARKAYGAIAGGVGGYLSSGRTTKGAVIGAGAGGAVGFFFPGGASSAGAATASLASNFISSIVGQMAGNYIAGNDILSNINLGAAIGASIGGMYGAYTGYSLAPGILSSSAGQFIGRASLEGFMIGGGEMLGSEFSKEFGGIFDLSRGFNFGEERGSSGSGALNPDNYSMGDFTF